MENNNDANDLQNNGDPSTDSSKELVMNVKGISILTIGYILGFLFSGAWFIIAVALSGFMSDPDPFSQLIGLLMMISIVNSYLYFLGKYYPPAKVNRKKIQIRAIWTQFVVWLILIIMINA